MRSRNTLVIVVCVSMMFSFIYGVVTVKYQIFPYEQLRAIKQIASPIPSQNTTYSDYFYHKKTFFEQHGGHEYDVVFIGDSITDGAEWEDLFPSLKIANRGIGGDRTDGVLKRLDSIYSTNARKAFIMIGINDFASGKEVNDVIKNYKSIIGKLIDHKMQVYIQSTILAGKRRKYLNIKIIALNNLLKKIAEETESVTYIDLNVGLAKASLLDSMYSRDDVHLNGVGYAVWKNLIKRYLH